MTLAEFLSKSGMTDAEFARRIGAGSRMTIGRYKRHERIPRRGHMDRILQETGGKVTAADFYLPAPDPKPRAPAQPHPAEAPA